MIPYSVIDAHCDTLTELCLARPERRSLLDCELHCNVRKQARYARFLQVLAIWADPAHHDVPVRVEQGINAFQIQMRILNAPESGVRVRKILDAEGLEQYFAEPADEEKPETAVLLAIEGGSCFGSELENVEKLYRRGVRLVTLTWNTPNAVSDTNLQADPEHPGLTAFGRAVVREMNRLGIVIDVSHLSDAGFWDVMAESGKPVIASHSDARALCAHPRNLTDGMFRELVRHGGVTGINFCRSFLGGSMDLTQIIRHIEHFSALGGVKNVGIGSDFDGIDRLPDGIAGTESLYLIFDKLLQLNYTQEQVEGIAGGNFRRVLQTVLKRKD